MEVPEILYSSINRDGFSRTVYQSDLCGAGTNRTSQITHINKYMIPTLVFTTAANVNAPLHAVMCILGTSVKQN